MQQIDEILYNTVARRKTPSVQYLFFGKEDVLHQYGYGLADVANNRTVEENTTYNLYSVTKTLTALAILQLAERNKIDLDLPVQNYLADFPYSPRITVRQLMTHSSGLPNPIPLSWIHLVGEHRSFEAQKFFDKVFERYPKTRFKPNERFAYSNLNYVFLGRLIEKISGASYGAYIEKNILGKLKLGPEDMGYAIADPLKHAKGYQKYWSLTNFILGFFIDKSKFMQRTEGSWKPFKNLYVNGTAHGGLIGKPIALMKYAQALLQSQNQLVTEKFKALLFTENRTKNGKPTGMCHSWFKGHLGSHAYYAHSGGGGGYYCELRIYPEINVGSVICFNRTGIVDERFLDRIDIHMLQNLGKPKMDSKIELSPSYDLT